MPMPRQQSVPNNLGLGYMPYDAVGTPTDRSRTVSNTAFKKVVRRGSELIETRWPFRNKNLKGDESCPIKDQDVQQAIVSLFQQKTLSSLEMTLLCENVKELSASELGPFIYDYYKNQLMTRGLRLLRDKVEKEAGLLLRSLAVMWDVFYQEILPMLQLVLRPIQVKELSIRYVTLLGFRDTVLFKTDVEEALSMWKGEFPPAIRQMLLILQSIPDGGKPSEAGLRLERLVAGVVSPFLGYMGLYLGSTEPAVRSCHYAQHVVMATRASPERFYDPQTARSPGTPSTPDLTPPTMRLKRHQRGASISVLGLNTSSEPLEPVLESAEINTHPKSKEIISQQNSIRRYSFSGAL